MHWLPQLQEWYIHALWCICDAPGPDHKELVLAQLQVRTAPLVIHSQVCLLVCEANFMQSTLVLLYHHKKRKYVQS